MSTPLNKELLIKKIKEAVEKGKKRRFKQSVELIVVLRGIDLNKPENRINLLVELPHPRGLIKSRLLPMALLKRRLETPV